MTEQIDINKIDNIITEKYGADPENLIHILQEINAEYTYIPESGMKRVAEGLNLPLSRIYSVATFYKAFSLEPKGKHHICVCTGTACHVRQASVIVDNLSLALGIDPRMTTPDREFSLETVNCLGAYALGPLVTINGEYHGKMTVSKMNRLLDKIRGVETEEEPAEEEL